MSDKPLFLRVSALSFVGRQVLLLGFLMLSLGILIGINLVAQPAMADVWAVSAIGHTPEVPEYLTRAGVISKVSAAAAAASLVGLLWLDYQET